jgi:hypothetical protein
MKLEHILFVHCILHSCSMLRKVMSVTTFIQFTNEFRLFYHLQLRYIWSGNFNVKIHAPYDGQVLAETSVRTAKTYFKPNKFRQRVNFTRNVCRLVTIPVWTAKFRRWGPGLDDDFVCLKRWINFREWLYELVNMILTLLRLTFYSFSRFSYFMRRVSHHASVSVYLHNTF